MLRGLTTTTFFADDVTAAVDWAVIYWAVDDVQDAFDRLISCGAAVHDEPTERGPGFTTASVVDPFGNVLGVMYNQHYLDVLSSRKGE
jgi:predicted enzyme related to lactoylglutathione lyase